MWNWSRPGQVEEPETLHQGDPSPGQAFLPSPPPARRVAPSTGSQVMILPAAQVVPRAEGRGGLLPLNTLLLASGSPVHCGSCSPASQRSHLALSMCHVVNARVIVPGDRSLIVLSAMPEARRAFP